MLFQVTILLKATANAPIMKKRKWLVEPDKSVASINQFIRKLLHLDENDSLVGEYFITFGSTSIVNVNINMRLTIDFDLIRYQL